MNSDSKMKSVRLCPQCEDAFALHANMLRHKPWFLARYSPLTMTIEMFSISEQEVVYTSKSAPVSQIRKSRAWKWGQGGASAIADSEIRAKEMLRTLINA